MTTPGILPPYDPAQIIVTVGARAISGYSDGTFVTVQRNADTFSMKSGCDGFVARAKTNDFTGSITITLLQTSPDNDYLTALMLEGEQQNAGVFPVKITDNLGTSVMFSANGWIRKPPNVEFSREVGSREWTIDVDRLEMYVGGSSGS